MGRAFGRLPHELRDVPLHWLLWDYLQLKEVVAVDELLAEGDRLRNASLTAIAFNKPALLKAERMTLTQRVRARSHRDRMSTRSDAEARAYGVALAAELARGRVFGEPTEGRA